MDQSDVFRGAGQRSTWQEGHFNEGSGGNLNNNTSGGEQVGSPASFDDLITLDHDMILELTQSTSPGDRTASTGSEVSEGSLEISENVPENTPHSNNNEFQVDQMVEVGGEVSVSSHNHNQYLHLQQGYYGIPPPPYMYLHGDGWSQMGERLRGGGSPQMGLISPAGVVSQTSVMSQGLISQAGGMSHVPGISQAGGMPRVVELSEHISNPSMEEMSRNGGSPSVGSLSQNGSSPSVGKMSESEGSSPMGTMSFNGGSPSFNGGSPLMGTMSQNDRSPSFNGGSPLMGTMSQNGANSQMDNLMSQPEASPHMRATSHAGVMPHSGGISQMALISQTQSQRMYQVAGISQNGEFKVAQMPQNIGLYKIDHILTSGEDFKVEPPIVNQEMSHFGEQFERTAQEGQMSSVTRGRGRVRGGDLSRRGGVTKNRGGGGVKTRGGTSRKGAKSRGGGASNHGDAVQTVEKEPPMLQEVKKEFDEPVFVCRRCQKKMLAEGSTRQFHNFEGEDAEFRHCIKCRNSFLCVPR